MLNYSFHHKMVLKHKNYLMAETKIMSFWFLAGIMEHFELSYYGLNCNCDRDNKLHES